MARRSIEALMAEPGWSALPVGSRRKAVDNSVAAARKLAKAEVLGVGAVLEEGRPKNLPGSLAPRRGKAAGEVRGMNWVIYDHTSKPPGTIEWG